jgi:hypothetical protein
MNEELSLNLSTNELILLKLLKYCIPNIEVFTTLKFVYFYRHRIKVQRIHISFGGFCVS